jgi:hypothetical protein
MALVKIKKQSVDNHQLLVRELIQALKEIKGWGSIEVYVQNYKVTQITKRAIKKTDHQLGDL